MDDQHSKTSGKTATAEMDQDRKDDRPDRSTTAGLGLFDKVTSMTGNPGGTITTGLGLPKFDATDGGVGTGITGVDRTVTTAGGVTYTSRFSDEDDRHWRQHHTSRPYYQSGRDYDEYRPAYQYGTDAAHQHQGSRWEEVEGDLERGWDNARGTSRSAWQDVKDAVRDAWDRATGGRHDSR